ncbi:MAG: ribose-5-phosphate isomerase RpiA [Gammaproteobacteria bacterium]
MEQEEKKRLAAKTALKYIEHDTVIGIGTGRTVNYFIECLGAEKRRIETTVASSKTSAALLAQHRIPVAELNDVNDVAVYVDGADEATKHLQLIKGGGGALTREKIIACASRRFVCIADESKLVDVLGQFPVAVEVIPMARSLVARQLVKLGGQPIYRSGFVTDNGNVILDVHNLRIINPAELEQAINDIPGVVGNGIFARRRPDVLLLGTETGVQELR